MIILIYEFIYIASNRYFIKYRVTYTRHCSLIAGWVVKPSVQRLSGNEYPRRVMVLSAVGVRAAA
jgi:hypothetical protein